MTSSQTELGNTQLNISLAIVLTPFVHLNSSPWHSNTMKGKRTRCNYKTCGGSIGINSGTSMPMNCMGICNEKKNCNDALQISLS